MDGKRPRQSGGFAGDIGDLIKHFPPGGRDSPASPRDDRALQEKRDIHAMLFEKAWRLDDDGKMPKN